MGSWPGPRVEALQAADASGRFGLWPNHERFLTILVPCVLTYREEGGRTSFAAVDGGVLLSEQNRVSVVTRDAVVAPRLEEVADAAAAMLRTRREQERAARAAFAELESRVADRVTQIGVAAMSPVEPEDDPFVREVRRQAERARGGHGLTFMEGLSLVGSVGWMVVLPALAGAAAGRWIDRRFGSGVFWTLSLMMFGLALGCATAWRHIQRDLARMNWLAGDGTGSRVGTALLRRALAHRPAGGGKDPAGRPCSRPVRRCDSRRWGWRSPCSARGGARLLLAALVGIWLARSYSGVSTGRLPSWAIGASHPP